MTDGNGIEPSGSGAKSLGEIVNEVSEKAVLLVREEIELAKAEVGAKAKSLGLGVGVGAAAGLFALLALVFLFTAIAFFFGEVVYGDEIWLGFLTTVVLLLALGAVAGLLAYRFIRKGTPPAPELAIEEAQETRRAIDKVRRS